VCEAVRQAVDWGLEHRDLSGVTAFGVDEVCFGAKAKFQTLVYQLCSSKTRLFFVAGGRAFWRGQLLENRENATGILSRMRERLTPAAAAGTYRGLGIAEEKGVDGQLVLFRPAMIGDVTVAG